MNSNLLKAIPVLPSQDIFRDVQWYHEKLGFQTIYSDNMYAVLRREKINLHLQWHADTDDDPLLGGSVVRILVDDIMPSFEEMLERKAISKDKLRMNTPWRTHEFGLYDLNKNAIFFSQDI